MDESHPSNSKLNHFLRPAVHGIVRLSLWRKPETSKPLEDARARVLESTVAPTTKDRKLRSVPISELECGKHHFFLVFLETIRSIIQRTATQPSSRIRRGIPQDESSSRPEGVEVRRKGLSRVSWNSRRRYPLEPFQLRSEPRSSAISTIIFSSL